MEILAESGESGRELGKLRGGEPEGSMGGREQIRCRGSQGDRLMGEESGEEGGIAGVREGRSGEGEQAMGEDSWGKATGLESQEMRGRGAQELAEKGEEEPVGTLAGASE